MKTFENLTIKQVKKEIIAWETSMGSEAKTVKVITIGQDPDNDFYYQGNGHLCEHFYAEILVDDEPMTRGYEWDNDEENITSSWDADQEEDEEEDPRTILTRWYGTAKGMIDDVDDTVTYTDIMDFFGFNDDDEYCDDCPSDELKAILDEFYKKMDDAQEHGITEKAMARLLDKTAAKIYAQAEKERGEG